MSMISWLLERIKDLYAMLASVPFLIFPLVLLAFYAVGKETKTATRRAADVTMVFLIGSVSATYDIVFRSELKGIWITLLILLLMIGLLGGLQTRARGRIDLEKLLRAVWRLGFVLFAPLYIVLSLIGLILTMVRL